MGPRRLYLGPHAPSLKDRLLDGPRPGLWLVPTPLARERLLADLALRDGGALAGDVLTWDDLWDRVRSRRVDGPVRAPEAALRAIRNEGIVRARRDGRLRILGDSASTPGFRKDLVRRFASWTRTGRDEHATPPKDPVDAARWAVFVAYRSLLARCGCEDAEGFATWASKALREDPTPLPAEVVALRPPEGRAFDRALEAMHLACEGMTVACVADADPESPRFGADPRRLATLRGWGFEACPVATDPGLPSGPARLIGGLFAEPGLPPLDSASGVAVRFAPEGEGQALAVARRVLDLIGEGQRPEGIAVVVPHAGATASLIAETLVRWGVPACDGRPSPMRCDPAVAAIRAAMLLPTAGWDAGRVAALLRNGRLRPRWSEADRPLALATAAAAIRESGAFRDAPAIRASLQRASTPRDDDDEERSRIRGLARERARVGLRVFDRLCETIEAEAVPGAWATQVVRLGRLARELGLRPDPGIDALLAALSDHAEVLDRLGRGGQVWSWSFFAEEAGGLIDELTRPAAPPPPGSVRVLPPEAVIGSDFDHVILADLGEGSFPSRSALDAAKSEGPEGLAEALAREQGRFLGLLGLARGGVTLVAPHADEKGNALLAAGFLDDVARLFDRGTWSAAARTLDRVAPVLDEDHAVAPGEARVRAVARACREDRFEDLSRLAAQPPHRRSLEGTARALRVSHWRSRRGRFGRYDGRMDDPRIAARLGEMFGSARRPFSASQLESLASCPFQFFQRYVLALDPPEDHEEMHEDAARRGSLMHRALETLHTRMRDLPDPTGGPASDRVLREIGPTLDALLDGERPPDSGIARGLARIQAGRLRQLGKVYSAQFRKYEAKPGRGAEGRHFEVAFGRPGNPYPALEIGEGPGGVAVSGIIDRIDFIPREAGAFFRVIDYKTGKANPKKEVETGIALQLPLYAIAAERLILAGEGARPLDAAYWSLKGKGFSAAATMTSDGAKAEQDEEAWRGFRRALERYLLDLVGRLRAGDLPLRPRKTDCARFCEYRFACRINHARARTKEWPEAPRVEIES